jgi:hypothetical protein
VLSRPSADSFAVGRRQKVKGGEKSNCTCAGARYSRIGRTVSRRRRKVSVSVGCSQHSPRHRVHLRHDVNDGRICGHGCLRLPGRTVSAAAEHDIFLLLFEDAGRFVVELQRVDGIFFGKKTVVLAQTQVLTFGVNLTNVCRQTPKEIKPAVDFHFESLPNAATCKCISISMITSKVQK